MPSSILCHTIHSNRALFFCLNLVKFAIKFEEVIIMKKLSFGLIGVLIILLVTGAASAAVPPVNYEDVGPDRIITPTTQENYWHVSFKNESKYPIVDYIVTAKYADSGKVIRMYCYDYVGQSNDGTAVSKTGNANGTGINNANVKGALEIMEISYTVDTRDDGWKLVTYDYAGKTYKVEDREKIWWEIRD